MGSVQLGIKVTDAEAASIETFLKALTGDKPYITYPQLPVITDKTPLPDMN
jgi:cytochrome c peroxidase